MGVKNRLDLVVMRTTPPNRGLYDFHAFNIIIWYRIQILQLNLDSINYEYGHID